TLGERIDPLTCKTFFLTEMLERSSIVHVHARLNLADVRTSHAKKPYVPASIFAHLMNPDYRKPFIDREMAPTPPIPAIGAAKTRAAGNPDLTVIIFCKSGHVADSGSIDGTDLFNGAVRFMDSQPVRGGQPD